MLAAITNVIVPSGALYIGIHESLAPAADGLEVWIKGLNSYRQSPDWRGVPSPDQKP